MEIHRRIFSEIQIARGIETRRRIRNGRVSNRKFLMAKGEEWKVRIDTCYMIDRLIKVQSRFIDNAITINVFSGQRSINSRTIFLLHL